MTANKVKGIRAAACSDTFSARMSRLHNDANIICLGARVVGAGLALDLARTFLETKFESGSRHQRRVNKINALDEC
jgi:ribose 5-phosphate isomerase B